MGDSFTYEFRPRVCPIFSKGAATSAVRFLRGRRPHFPSRLRARRILGVISAFIASFSKHERPVRPISKAEALGWEICSTFCSRGPVYSGRETAGIIDLIRIREKKLNK